jgi:hypothetical protein
MQFAKRLRLSEASWFLSMFDLDLLSAKDNLLISPSGKIGGLELNKFNQFVCNVIREHFGNVGSSLVKVNGHAATRVEGIDDDISGHAEAALSRRIAQSLFFGRTP